METLANQVRLAVLWIVTAVAFVGYRTVALSEDATNVSLLGNADFATYLLVLLGFAFLAATLPFRLNRSVNRVAGGIVGIVQVIMLVDGVLGYPSATFNLLTGATIVSLAAVVWFAARWHQPGTADDESARPSERGHTRPDIAPPRSTSAQLPQNRG